MQMPFSKFLAVLTCAPTLLLAFPPSTQAQGEYAGTVVNSALPASPASLTIWVHTDDGHHVTGYVEIGAPLGGSGAFRGRRSGDTLYLVTTSGTGDTSWRMDPALERALTGA